MLNSLVVFGNILAGMQVASEKGNKKKKIITRTKQAGKFQRWKRGKEKKKKDEDMDDYG